MRWCGTTCLEGFGYAGKYYESSGELKVIGMVEVTSSMRVRLGCPVNCFLLVNVIKSASSFSGFLLVHNCRTLRREAYAYTRTVTREMYTCSCVCNRKQEFSRKGFNVDIEM